MKFYFYCKSYRGDLERAKVLCDSFKRHNLDNLPLVISVPTEDIAMFKEQVGYAAEVVTDDSIVNTANMRGWLSQQIIKTHFWKAVACDAYMVLDSDCYFIRPFRLSDFVHESGVPYTVMHEQKDLFDWSCNKKPVLGFDPQESFAECRLKVMELFDRRGKLYDFGPVPVIWSSAVWQSLEHEYLAPNGLTLAQAIEAIPSEFTWYGEWLLANKTIPLYPIEPLFKVFHYPHQYNESKQAGYREEDYSKIWYGIVMQSNWRAPLRY